jgi:transcriptional regulator with XRE-family HTH domain
MVLQGYIPDMPGVISGAELRALRESKGLSREQVAHRGGLVAHQIYRYETGKQPLDAVSMLVALARGLDVPLAALLQLPETQGQGARMKQLCDIEETAHKLAEDASDEAWELFLEQMSSATTAARNHAEGRKRYRKKQSK